MGEHGRLLSDEHLDLMEQWERQFPSYRMIRGNVADAHWGRDIPLLSKPTTHTDVLDLLAHARVLAERVAALEASIARYREMLTSNVCACPVCAGPVTVNIVHFPATIDGSEEYDIEFEAACLDQPDKQHRLHYLPDGDGWADEEIEGVMHRRAEFLRAFECALDAAREEAGDV